MNAIARAGKTILNAMAFANAGNDSECRALLRDFGNAVPKDSQPQPPASATGRTVIPAAAHPAGQGL